MQTILVLTLIPLAVYLLITLIVLWPKFSRPRYRAGEGWNFAPVFWVANPVDVGTSGPAPDRKSEPGGEQDANTARGGARGNW